MKRAGPRRSARGSDESRVTRDPAGADVCRSPAAAVPPTELVEELATLLAQALAADLREHPEVAAATVESRSGLNRDPRRGSGRRTPAAGPAGELEQHRRSSDPRGGGGNPDPDPSDAGAGPRQNARRKIGAARP